MGTFAVAWCFYMFLPYLCRNMSNFAVQNFFALFTFDDFFCAHCREKHGKKHSIPQWFVDAPGMFRVGEWGLWLSSCQRVTGWL